MQNKFDKLRCCVIIPTYNNAAALPEVIKGILAYTCNVIVVNDGSTDATASVLSSFPDCKVISHEKNEGKGMALRNGFKYALSLGYEYAITIDSDGQHMPEDLPGFLDMLEKNPGALIVGARDMSQENVPGKSSFGNKFSNFWYRVETGIVLPDTQSGYRLYPIHKMAEMTFFTKKFEFEIEVMVRAAWAGIPVLSIPVQVYYASEESRISHFRPVKDFLRISVLNTILVVFAFLYFRPAMYIRGIRKKGWQQIIGTKESNLKLSLAVGFGVFMGIVPIWGYQMITAIMLAYFFRLNKVIVVLAANISFPPVIPIIVYLSFWLGGFFF